MTSLKFKTLTALAREDGLISSKNVNDEIMISLGFSNPKERIRDIVDWPPAQKDTGWKLSGPNGERDGYDMVEINTVVNAFYYRNLVLMAEIGRTCLTKTEDSVSFQNESDKVRNSFNQKLLDRTKGIYIDGENSRPFFPSCQYDGAGIRSCSGRKSKSPSSVSLNRVEWPAVFMDLNICSKDCTDQAKTNMLIAC